MPRPPAPQKLICLSLRIPRSVRWRIERLMRQTEAASMTEVIRRALECYEKSLKADHD